MLMICGNRYNLSKLFQVFVIRKLASMIDPTTDDKSADSTPIVINCLDPCYCRSELGRDLSPLLKPIGKIFEFLFARTTEEGSRLVVIAASAGRKTHGGYMRGGNLKSYSPLITSEDGIQKERYVWEQLERKLEGIQSGILANVK
jgi:retinol dehydrogenase-12